MVAHAALVSLLQILDSIIQPATTGRRIYHNRAQLKSLHEKVSFLLDFLENSSSDYGKTKDSEIEILERKMRDAASKAEDVIESDVSNQLLAEVDTAILFFLLLWVLLVLYRVFQDVTAFWILAFIIPILRDFLFSIQYLLPLSFHIVIFLMSRILYPLMIDILPPFLFSSAMAYSAWTVYTIRIELIRGSSFARYWLYASQSENQDLCPAIDDFSLIMKEVIKIKDVCSSSGQSVDDLAGGLSRRDFGSIGKNGVVGLDGDLNEIYARLTGYPPELEIVSIVGMGGIGKTTLARQVHDNPRIVFHFDICAWVTVSQEYSLRRIMLGLLGSAKIRAEEILQQTHRSDDDLCQKLGEHLHKNLMSRRYLVVMDDMWDTKIWDFVRIFFPDNNNGSRVLLTTRLSEVASYANSGSPCIQMRFLNDGDSWHLLREKVFGGEGCPPELEAIGKMIARNCRGLPLAIVIVGGVLYNQHRTMQDWTHVSKNLNSILSKNDEQCLEILSLSYLHLPHRLKPCFLYMGAFPEDTEIRVTKLFQLWGAEGFLEASKSKSLEEVAEEYLKDLIQRNLIMVTKWRCDGKIRTCKIHDLIRDVCWLHARKENFLYFYNWVGEVHHDGAEIRHRLSTLFDFANACDEFSRNSYIMARSFICADEMFYDLSQIYLSFRLLRVLDIVAATLHEFPDEILKLFHLRYLGLTYNYLLPPSISQLWNLQTIVYRGRRFGRALWLPVEIWSMPNLRHLYFRGGLLPDPPRFQLLPNTSTVLENLQTLVGLSDFRCTKGILRSIPNLKKLGISYDGRSECQPESLVNLHELEALKITAEHGVSVSTSHPKLAFPQKLKRLSLSGCRIPWESLRIVGALPSLQVLKLRNHACVGRNWETVEGEFCQLIFLFLEDSDLEHWRSNETHFPCLQRLILRQCDKLQEVPRGMGEIATLERIELVDCHPSAVASAMQLQEEQQSMGNEDLKFHIEETYFDRK